MRVEKHPARPFFKRDRLSYLDYASWIDAERCVEWQFEVGVFPDAVKVQGVHHFTPEGESSTSVLFTGDVSVDLSRVRGIPRFLHRLQPKVERYLLGQVKPNLAAVTNAVTALLDGQREG